MGESLREELAEEDESGERKEQDEDNSQDVADAAFGFGEHVVLLASGYHSSRY